MKRLTTADIIRITIPVLLLVVVGGLLRGMLRPMLWPSLSESEIRQTVVTTIQAEAAASFYVTGVLTLTATVTVENTRYLFPDALRLNLGTTRARVRLPGRVSYGFDVRTLRPEDIVQADDGVIEVQLPALELFSIEPDLDALEVQTRVGWARLYARSGQRTTERALGFAQQALRDQATDHLETATQPRINTAEALQTLLTPPLRAAGLDDPRFRIRLGPRLVVEPGG